MPQDLRRADVATGRRAAVLNARRRRGSLDPRRVMVPPAPSASDAPEPVRTTGGSGLVATHTANGTVAHAMTPDPDQYLMPSYPSGTSRSTRPSIWVTPLRLDRHRRWMQGVRLLSRPGAAQDSTARIPGSVGAIDRHVASATHAYQEPPSGEGGGSSCSMNSSRMPPGAFTNAMRRFPNAPSTIAGPHTTVCPSNSASKSSVNRAG